MTKLVWRSQYYMWQPHECTDILHYARCKYGVFEIYDDGAVYLLSFPKRLKSPAEIFNDLNDAKKAAEKLMPREKPKRWFWLWFK